ncbi:hypothetical protein PSE_4771 [Pseudovibrio sp. FO-BEG1]|nr:hypothetical protein PSE_4771 [Pseudovibrio sp. FO-BEG1]
MNAQTAPLQEHSGFCSIDFPEFLEGPLSLDILTG